MPDPATIGAIAGASALAGPAARGFGPTEDFKTRQQQRDFLEHSVELLSSDRIGSRFQDLQGISGDFINQLLAEAGVIGQAQASSAQAGLGRLGFSGIGTGVGAGLRAGANFQGLSLRAKMLQGLLDTSVGIQSQLSANFAGIAANPIPHQPSQLPQAVGAGIQAASLTGGGGQQPPLAN